MPDASYYTNALRILVALSDTRLSFISPRNTKSKLLGVNGCVNLRDGQLALDAGCCWVDAWVLKELLQRADGGADEDPEKALSLYQGPFLADEDDPLVLPLREQLHSRFLRAALGHGQNLERGQNKELAIDWYEKLMEIDPLVEEVYRRQMSNLLKLGRPAEALAVYQRCRRVLRSLQRTEPGPQILALCRAIQQASASASAPGD